jgi:hypothetical protein
MTHPIPRDTTSTTGHRLGHRRASAARAAAVALTLVLLAGPALLAAVKIEHDPVEKSKSGHRIELEAEIKDKAAGVHEARAYFKSGHDTRFWFAPMRPVGGKHVGILPAPALGAETVEYRIYAVNGVQDFVKTQTYVIQIKDDEKALARMEAKEPTNVEIDLDQIEQMRDLAREAGEPDPSSQVEVRNDVPGSEMPTNLVGFQDYIVMAEAVPAAAGAGLAGAATVTASGAGIGAGAILGTTLALGGVAAAVGEADSGDDGGGDGGGTGGPGAIACNNQEEAGSDNPVTIDVELGQRSGTFTFQYQMFTQRDRMRVIYQGATLFDTGCVSGSASRMVSYNGSNTHITVDVIPNCNGGSGTLWEFTVLCP